MKRHLVFLTAACAAALPLAGLAQTAPAESDWEEMHRELHAWWNQMHRELHAEGRVHGFSQVRTSLSQKLKTKPAMPAATRQRQSARSIRRRALEHVRVRVRGTRGRTGTGSLVPTSGTGAVQSFLETGQTSLTPSSQEMTETIWEVCSERTGRGKLRCMREERQRMLMQAEEQ